MCGRYSLTRDELRFLAQAGECVVKLELPRSAEVAPTDSAPVIVWERSEYLCRPMRWGMALSWSKRPLINARAESLSEKKVFSECLQNRRCLVPADGFYEWRHDGVQNLPLHFVPPEGGLVCFAGLWAPETRPPGARDKSDDRSVSRSGGQAFTIVTTAANAAVRPVHDRMPVIVPAGDYATWLDPLAATTQLAEIFSRAWGARLEGRPVRGAPPGEFNFS